MLHVYWLFWLNLMGRFWGNSVQKIFGELLGSYSGLMKGLVTIEDSYSVYMHTFPNDKTYVGITKQDLKARWGSHGQGYKGQAVYDAINEFGWDNIKHEVLMDGVSKEEAKRKECELIDKYKNLDLSYNISNGGGCGGLPWCEFIYKGKVYTADELASISDVDGLTGHDITTRVNHHGWSIEEAITKDKVDKNKKYLYKGNYYSSRELYDLVKPENITYAQLVMRLTQHNWDPERAVTQPNNKKKQPFGVGERIYEYNGKMYNTYELSQISDVEGLDAGDIWCRINHHGWTVERAITQPKRNKNPTYEYEGKIYNSYELADICVSPEITHIDVNMRRRKGWTTWEIVNIPKGMKKSQFYKQLKNNPHANQQPSQSNLDKSRLEGPETNSRGREPIIETRAPNSVT